MVHFANDKVGQCRRTGSSGFGFTRGRVVLVGVSEASTVIVASVGLVDVPESSVSLEMFIVFEYHGFVRTTEVRIVLLLKAIMHSCCDVQAAALVMIKPSVIKRVISIAHNDIRMVLSLAISTGHIAQLAKLPAIRPLQRDTSHADRIFATPELKIRSLFAFTVVAVDKGAGGNMRVVSTAVFADELVVFVEGDGTGGQCRPLG